MLLDLTGFCDNLDFESPINVSDTAHNRDINGYQWIEAAVMLWSRRVIHLGTRSRGTRAVGYIDQDSIDSIDSIGSLKVDGAYALLMRD